MNDWAYDSKIIMNIEKEDWRLRMGWFFIDEMFADNRVYIRC